MRKFTLHINGRLFEIESPMIMTILNCWSRSFSGNTQARTDKEFLHQVEHAIADGASILDLGACPTHPRGTTISEEEEWQHIARAARLIRERWPEVWLSVDTYRSEIAKRSVSEYGVNIINDISGGQLDPQMFSTVAQLHVPYVLTHMRGTPETMQQETQYEHLVSEVVAFLHRQLDQLQRLGVSDVFIDPGFGFAKTLEQNYHLLAHLADLSILDRPLLVGISRKSMLYNLLHTTPQETLNATTAAHVLALERGACVLRVHDTQEAAEAIKIYLQTINNY